MAPRNCTKTTTTCKVTAYLKQENFKSADKSWVENKSQEDLNYEIFEKYPSEWNTHIVSGEINPDLRHKALMISTNKFKIVEAKVLNEVNTAMELVLLPTQSHSALRTLKLLCRRDGFEWQLNSITDHEDKKVNKLIGIQIPDKSRKGVRFLSYNDVPPPSTGLFSPPKFDLSNSSLEEFQQPEFEGYGPRLLKSVSEEISNEVGNNSLMPYWLRIGVNDKLEKKTVFLPTLTAIYPSKGKGGIWNSFIQGHNDVDARGRIQVMDGLWPPRKLIFHIFNAMDILKRILRLLLTWILKSHGQGNVHLSDFKEFHEEMLPLGRAKGEKITRFTWVFFLATKDETSGILKSFITEIENLVDKKVKIIRCDNGTEFKNRVMSEFCEKKGIKKEFSVARTPQQNGVAERRNRTLIEAARTMLADSKLPTTFWAEAVNTACYVQNRVLVVKPYNKTPYELFRGRTPALSFMRPFGCHVTILNTLDYLGKFDGKSDEGFFVGYSMNSKAFRVYNIRTRKVEENLHIRFLEDKPIIAGDGPKWLFDIDVLTKLMNYVPVVAGTNSNDFVGTKESIGAGHSSKETGSSQDYILMPLWKDGSLFDSSSKNASNDEPQPPSDAGKKDDEGVCKESGIDDQERPESNTQDVNTAGPSINTEPDMFSLGDNATLEATHADFFGDETKSGVQTRRMTKTTNEQGFISAVYEGKTHKDLHTCLFACFLSQEEPKRIAKALSDSAWVEAMQEELLQFKLQKVWVLVDLPKGKRVIGTKWIFMNKKDERGIEIRNKARMVSQGHTQEEGIDYDEVFAPIARIEATRLFLAYASFIGFIVYQMDVNSTFLYGRIEEEVYVCQAPGFEDPDYLDKVYRVVKALYGLHQALRAWYETLAKYLLDNGFHRGKVDQTLFIKKQKGDILLVQDKYVAEILRKFSFTDVRTTSTPMDTEKPLLKDSDDDDVDVHLYRSMIGSLMHLTSSRPDIMCKVCACARFLVIPKVSHLHAVKRIFTYLKGQPKLGLWYLRDSSFDLVAYSDSDYAGVSFDRKPTTGGCQFLGCRLISWQCKKQIVAATSSTEAEYVAAASCCGQDKQSSMVGFGDTIVEFVRRKSG
ncbi:putative ribonuclease H-like domain-containing protein [Tanacetum coccineum]